MFQQSETALRQIAQLGFQQSDVRHIVLTHFDFDHIGVPLRLRSYEGMTAFNRRQLRDNRARLAELYERGEHLDIVCAHDPGLFEQTSR